MVFRVGCRCDGRKASTGSGERIVTVPGAKRQGKKNDSQRGTGVTSVRRITYTRGLSLCRLQLINQQLERPARRMRRKYSHEPGAVLLFCGRRDYADAGVVLWARGTCCLQIRCVLAEIRDQHSGSLSVVQVRVPSRRCRSARTGAQACSRCGSC
jgi:hypothetical protein